MADTKAQAPRDLLIAGLRDAHALERQAVAVLEPQLRSLRDFPEFRDRVARHVEESRVQAGRLEAALARCGASTSTLKDLALSAMGLGQSAVQMFASDAPLKALLADTMFEHLEIASYRALIELADLAGQPDLKPDLETSLREEEAMADWLEANLVDITRRFASRSSAAGSAADRPAAAAPRAPGPGSASPDPASPSPPAPGAGEAPAEPEQPLRDFEEFTDSEPAEADWPDGTERPKDRPAAG